jgi:hypothetical protein
VRFGARANAENSRITNCIDNLRGKSLRGSHGDY